jgi:two-component system, NarL family, invasion response regulator UvrY
VLVDDFGPLRELVRLELESSGDFRVVAEASDGEQGLAAVTQHLPDYVLLDLDMPRVGGWAALPRLRAKSPASCIILYTEETADITARARRHGANGIVSKRVGGAALVAALLRFDPPPHPAAIA